MRNVNLFGMSWNVNLFGKLGKSKILQSASDLHIWIFAGDAKLFFCKTHMLVLARDIHRKKKKRNLSINDPKLTITITYLWLLQSWPNLGQQPSPPSPFFSPQLGHRPPIRVCDKYVKKIILIRQIFIFYPQRQKKIPCNCAFHPASPHSFSSLAAKPFNWALRVLLSYL